MSDLLSLLSLGSNAIQAQNTGLSVATNNVANVNTKGFSRQRVDLNALMTGPLGGGVIAGNPDRLQDNLLAGRIRTSSGSLSMSTSFHQAVLDVENRMSSAGPTVHEQLGTLASRMAELTATPTDTITRDSVVQGARDLISGVRRRAAELSAAQDESNARIREKAAQISSLSQRLGQTNLEIQRSHNAAMQDERDKIANQLSELTGGTARIDGDGQMRFVLDGGAVLVDGSNAAKMEATPDPVTGDQKLEVVAGASRRDVTANITSGSLGADLKVRDGVIAKARTDLDQLAFDISTSYNTAHKAGAGLDGVSGRNMFTQPTQVAGAANAMALDPGLDADSSKLAAAAPGGGAGDNTGAKALLAVSSAPVAAGGKTLTGAALDMISSIGVAASDAKSDVTRDQLVSDNLAGLRDSLAGVDIQEELSNLARFEHATTAMTRFVSTVDGLLGDLIDRL
jgi:flagellar hook-associated protein 1 FlgK